MSLLYSAGRNTLENADWGITTDTGNLTANSYYFSIQARNRIGVNYLLESALITVGSNSSITITINSTAKLSGEGWLSYIIGFCPSASYVDISSYIQLAELFILDPTDDFQTELTFPLTLEITEDRQLQYKQILANSSNFPTTDLINGELKGLLSNGNIYRYDYYDTTSIPDGEFIYAATPSGRWKYIGTWYVDISNIESVDGAKQDLRYVDIPNSILVPKYSLNDTNSPNVDLWLVNNLGTQISQGTRISFTVTLDDLIKTNLFDNKINVTIVGFVNLTTYELRTTYLADVLITIPELGVMETYSLADNNIKLPDTLDVGEAVLLRINAKVDKDEFLGLIPDNSYFKILPSFTQLSSNYTSAGELFGKGIILNETDTNFRRIVPNVGLSCIALDGSGIVDNYIFPNLPIQEVYSLAVDTVDQKILISRQGNCYRSITSSIPIGAALRALVSTASGESIASNWTAYTAVSASQLLTVTLNYPCDADGYGNIRTDYNDVIAGNQLGKFNPEKVNVYVQRQSDGEIRQYNYTVIPDVSQDVQITAFDGTVVGSVPNTNFGLFTPVSNSFVSGSGGSFGADDYRVCYSFVYEGNSVTDISHSVEDGCITEQSISFDLLLDSSKYWGIYKETILELKLTAIRELIDNRVFFCKETERIYYYDSLNTGTPDDLAIVECINSTGNFISISGSGISDGDKGDITVSSGGTVFTIDNDVVTYAKIQNISATDKLLGRSTIGSGDIEEIDCTAFGRSLIDDATASDARTTLGLGTLATQSGTFSGTSSGTNTGDQNTFSAIAVSGQSTINADSTSDTLTLVAGTNITIATNDTTDTITIASSAAIDDQYIMLSNLMYF